MIYLAKEGKSDGPYTEDDLRARVAAGTLELSCQAWKAGCAGWEPLGGLLGMSVPPPLPASVATSSRPVPSSRPALIAPSSSVAIVVFFVAAGLGLLGAYGDLHIAGMIDDKIQHGHADFNSFVASLSAFWQIVVGLIAGAMGSSTDAQELMAAIRHVERTLTFFGILGILSLIGFVVRRYVTIPYANLRLFAVLMLACGVLPLFMDTAPFGLAGLPLALGGLCGLFAHPRLLALRG